VNLLDYSQKLKAGDQISNINDGRKAKVIEAFKGGVTLEFEVGGEIKSQFLVHEVVNDYWRWLR